MLTFGQALIQARTAAGLEVADLAELTGIEGSVLASFEAGVPASGKVMDRCALAFGVRVGDFLNGEGERADVALLFKRVGDIEAPERSRHQLIDLDRQLGVSTFCRIARDLAELSQALGRARPPLPDLTPLSMGRSRDPAGVEQLALAARRALDIPSTGPIASVRGLFERLQIPVVVCAPEEVDPRVSGASVMLPRPTVLLVPTWNRTWRNRMTLAHELCHLLFHHAGLSVSGESDWRFDADYDAREQEANAFAASFLAPALAVQQLIQSRRPDDEAAIAQVGSHFGIGRQVAVNRLVDSFRLTPSRRDAMLAMGGRWADQFPEDALKDEELGLRRGPLRALVLEALRTGCVSKTRARVMLEIPDDQPIEAEGLTPEQQAPVLSPEQWAARRCQVELDEQGLPWIVGTLEPLAGGYTAQLLDPRGTTVGQVRVRADGTLAEAPPR